MQRFEQTSYWSFKWETIVSMPNSFVSWLIFSFGYLQDIMATNLMKQLRTGIWSRCWHRKINRSKIYEVVYASMFKCITAKSHHLLRSCPQWLPASIKLTWVSLHVKKVGAHFAYFFPQNKKKCCWLFLLLSSCDIFNNLMQTKEFFKRNYLPKSWFSGDIFLN